MFTKASKLNLREGRPQTISKKLNPKNVQT